MLQVTQLSWSRIYYLLQKLLSSCFTVSHCCSSALQKLLSIWKRKLLPSMLPEVQYTISQKNQCEAIHLGICHVAFLLLPGTYNVFFWIPHLTVASHSLGQGQQLLCGFLQLLGRVPFILAGSFPCKTRCLHWNALSLLPRALTATWWKHLPLTLTCYEVERSLDLSPGKKDCWSLERFVWGAAVGSGCTPPCTAKCRSTCLANAFAVLSWNRSSIEPAISHPNEWDFWMQRGLQSQHRRTVIWQVSRSGRGRSELWASKNKAHVRTSAFLSRFSEQRSLSCQNHTVLLASSHFSLNDILWGLSSAPSGKRPCRTSIPRGWESEPVWGPTMLEEEGICATTAGGFWMRAAKASHRRLLAIETGAEHLAINTSTAFIYSDCKGLCPKGRNLFSSIIMRGE